MLRGGSERSALTRRLLCSTKMRHLACQEKALDTSPAPFNKTASLLHLFVSLIVDVQVCIRELFYSRKRLLDCFIGLKSHCYRLDVPSIGANRGGLVISELIKKDFRLRSTNADRSDRPLQKQSVALKTCVVEVMKNKSPTRSIVGPESYNR